MLPRKAVVDPLVHQKAPRDHDARVDQGVDVMEMKEVWKARTGMQYCNRNCNRKPCDHLLLTRRHLQHVLPSPLSFLNASEPCAKIMAHACMIATVFAYGEKPHKQKWQFLTFCEWSSEPL